MYSVTKHYGHNLGLSACFRQPLAESHCSKLHGYALAFTVEVAADHLDKNNWVLDFGSFKSLKQTLYDTFDHKTLIAAHDEALLTFRAMHNTGMIDLIVMEKVGCEAFAEYVYKMMDMDIYTLPEVLHDGNPRNLRVVKVTCHEHGGNSATYHGDK